MKYTLRSCASRQETVDTYMCHSCWLQRNGLKLYSSTYAAYKCIRKKILSATVKRNYFNMLLFIQAGYHVRPNTLEYSEEYIEK